MVESRRSSKSAESSQKEKDCGWKHAGGYEKLQRRGGSSNGKEEKGRPTYKIV